MDGCQKFCRVVMLLLGIFSLSVAIFTCYDLGKNFMDCRLPFVIIGRLGIACSTLFISSRCGLLPMPKIPVFRNLPAPWVLWDGSCCQSTQSTQLQRVSSGDLFQPQASTSQVHDDSTPFLVKHKRDETSDKTYGTFSQSTQHRHDSADDCYQAEASTSKAHNVNTAFPVLLETGAIPQKKHRTFSRRRLYQKDSADKTYQPEASTSETRNQSRQHRHDSDDYQPEASTSETRNQSRQHQYDSDDDYYQPEASTSQTRNQSRQHQHDSADDCYQAEACTSKAHNVNTAFPVLLETGAIPKKKHRTFSRRRLYQKDSADKTYQPEAPTSQTRNQGRRHQHDSDDDYNQPEASTSQTRNVSTDLPFLCEEGESPNKMKCKKKAIKKVRFSLPEGQRIPEKKSRSRRTRENTKSHKQRSKNVPYYQHADPYKFLERVQLENPPDQSTTDHFRSWLIDQGMKVELPSVLKETGDQPSRVVVEQNRERDEGSPNAVSRPIPAPQKSVHYASGTPPRVRQMLYDIYAFVKNISGVKPPTRASRESSSSESNTKEDFFDSDIGDKMSP